MHELKVGLKYFIKLKARISAEGDNIETLGSIFELLPPIQKHQVPNMSDLQYKNLEDHLPVKNLKDRTNILIDLDNVEFIDIIH